jgi:hypothetical protein
VMNLISLLEITSQSLNQLWQLSLSQVRYPEQHRSYKLMPFFLQYTVRDNYWQTIRTGLHRYVNTAVNDVILYGVWNQIYWIGSLIFPGHIWTFEKVLDSCLILNRLSRVSRPLKLPLIIKIDVPARKKQVSRIAIARHVWLVEVSSEDQPTRVLTMQKT